MRALPQDTRARNRSPVSGASSGARTNPVLPFHGCRAALNASLMERAQRRLSPSGNAGTVPGSTHRRFSRAAGLERGASLRLRRSLPTFSPGRNCRLARGFEAGHRSATGPIGTLISYYGYRYLDTQLGRWLSRDPIGEKGGLNLYAFVMNQSISAFDILGLRESYKTRAGAADAGNRAAREAADKDLEERKNKKKPGEDIVMRPFEFGGRICCDSETKTFYLTGPGTSNEDELIKVQDMPPCDEGDVMVGYYHSHPHGGGFSEGDKSVAANGKKKDYPTEKHTNKQGEIDIPYQVPPNIIAGVMARYRGEWVSLIYIPGVGTFRRNPNGDVNTKDGWVKID